MFCYLGHYRNVKKLGFAFALVSLGDLAVSTVHKKNGKFCLLCFRLQS